MRAPSIADPARDRAARPDRHPPPGARLLWSDRVCVVGLMLALVTGSAVACRSRGDRLLSVSVGSPEPLPGVVHVQVAVSQKAPLPSQRVLADWYASVADIGWPIVLQVHVGPLGSGDTLVEARAFDAGRTEIARGARSFTLPQTTSVTVELVCDSLACQPAPGADGGAGSGGDGPGGADGGGGDGVAADGGAPETVARCGNATLDRDETCDTAIAAELPGACPRDCDDGIACTEDRLVGTGCTVTCQHSEIRIATATDGCCPAGATSATDPDCSAACGDGVLGQGESCDTMIATGPGTCPGAADCDDGDPCTVDALISAGTCSARCSHVAILVAVAGDGCCPVGANTSSDADCRPACGNGLVEAPELCDPGISGRFGATGASGSGRCPTSADCDDKQPCTADILVGSGCQTTCQHLPITTPVPNDGCCPDPSTIGPNVDNDCKATCGNGVLEAGEACDTAIRAGTAGACPTGCPAPQATCSSYVMTVTPGKPCDTVCLLQPTTACSAVADGCCPKGCGSASDPDCPPSCGDGHLDPGEACDVAIPAGQPGACPKSCSDAIPCTDDLLIDADSCTARCVFVPTTTFRDGDGCCPPGGHEGLDADCPASCGNGVVEVPWETCDTASTPVSCAAGCPPSDSCSPYVIAPGSTSACNIPCVRQAITSCVNGDGCCPEGAGCSAANDSDCGAICGNGVLDANEACDPGITAGKDGACAASCADTDSCTLDFARGTPSNCDRVCSHVRITTCGSGDHCCPDGCSAANDADCAPSCGNGIVENGETCDPSSTCPVRCQDDGDACTVDELVGAASQCNASCQHVPILGCSGKVHDGCCPTGCTPTLDADC